MSILDVTFIWRSRRVRLLAVGVLNTVFGYGLFFCLLIAGLSPTPALALATIIGVAFNFFSMSGIVFANRDPARLWRFAGVYGVVFVVNAIALEGIEKLGIRAALGQAMLLPLCVCLSYLLNSTLVFNTRVEETRP